MPDTPVAKVVICQEYLHLVLWLHTSARAKETLSEVMMLSLLQRHWYSLSRVRPYLTLYFNIRFYEASYIIN